VLNSQSVSFSGMPVGLNIVSASDGLPVSFLEENGRYEYELDSPQYSLKEISGVLSHSRISHDNERGVIEPGNYVGLLKLELFDKTTDSKVSETYVNGRSTKLGYDEEYRSMLEDIADRCADFLLQIDSPVDAPLDFNAKIHAGFFTVYREPPVPPLRAK
jgi:Domain of unknown function (DUF2357)